MHLLPKVQVAEAMNTFFLPKILNINTDNPGLCHNKRICALS